MDAPRSTRHSMDMRLEHPINFRPGCRGLIRRSEQRKRQELGISSTVSIFSDIKSAQNHYSLFSPETTSGFVGCVDRVLDPKTS